MIKIKNIQTPKNVQEFRTNIKKYCLGHKDSIFIFNKINSKKYKINANKLSKISDVSKFIKDDKKQMTSLRDCELVLMIDISHLCIKNIKINSSNTLNKLKEAYLFNNQDSYERKNFLNSTPNAIEKIVTGEEINVEIDANPKKTAINSKILRQLYNHLFGKYFDAFF